MKLEEQTKRGRVIPFLPDGDYYFEKGISAYQHGDLERAKKFVERAIVFNPNDPDYLCQLAAIFAEMEEFEASNRLLKKVVFEIDPSLAECFFFMANNYAYLGRYEEAMQDIKRYMSLEPNGSFFQEARDLYKLLVSESGTEPEPVETYITDHEKGRQALQRGDFTKAIYYLKKALKERPEFWATQNNLAIAYFSSGQTEKGLQQLELILQKDPGNIHALCNKATFYFQIGDDAEVQRLLPMLDVLYPMYPEGRSKLGATYFFLGQDQKAYHWLTSAEKTGLFEDQTFYYWLAVTSYRLGHTEKAFKAWKKVAFFNETPFQPFEYGKIKELIKEVDAKENRLVRSLVEHEVKEGELESQLISLFILYDFADQEAIHLLQEVSQDAKKALEIREIAEQLFKVLEGSETEDRLAIIFSLQDRLEAGDPLLHHLKIYKWWLRLFLKLGSQKIDVVSWSAALEYRWLNQMDQKRVTQAEICDTYGITTYKLRRHLSLLDEVQLED